MKYFIVAILFAILTPLVGQTSYDELVFEPDSIVSPYKPTGKNAVFIRSKRGTSGVNKTALADAILTAEVTEIVLVFSELDPSAIASREEANRERWENLLLTYPELFQFTTTYKNLCQCNDRGDSASFKKAQGFYVYINGEVPKVEEPKVAATPPPAEKPAKVEEKQAPAAPAKTEEKPAAVAKPEKTEIKETNIAVADKTEVKTKEMPLIEKPVKEVTKEVEPPAAKEAKEESHPAEEVVKASPKKKSGVVKPRKAKDPKACRMPCYGYSDDDLNTFFKDNMAMTKKQRRKAKKSLAVVRLQLHFDGSIKKVIVTGADEVFNLKVQDAIKMMNNWNAAVKNGLAVKAEVKFTIKYDKETKSMKPFDMSINPRLAPKCKCASDSELFGSD